MIDPQPHLALTIQKAIGKANRDNAPSSTDMRRWAQAALQGSDVELTVRLVGATEGRELNRDFRGKDYATNVLTFVYGDDEGMSGENDDAAPLAGDLVLCVPVVVREAAEQGKPLAAHFAHLIVHGMLHLQGYDHEDGDEAEEMEALETRILAELGYPDPYADRSA